MENIEKNYKNYYINTQTAHTKNKIKALKEMLQVNKNTAEDFDSWYYKEAMTDSQYKYFKNGDFKKLKELIKKQIQKEKTKLISEKEEALKKYQDIKELKDIKEAVIDIMWSRGRRSMGAYQTKATARVTYKNGDFKYYETNYTGGCGYDKKSTSMSRVCNELLKIVFIKHYKKIVNDAEKHYKYYAGESGYFQYGVGLSSYYTFFKNCGYKVKEIYHSNEDTTIIISKYC